MMFRPLLFSVALGACLASSVLAQKQLTREEQVRKDKQDFAENDAWFYDDLGAGIKEANRTNRPLIIVFR